MDKNNNKNIPKPKYDIELFYHLLTQFIDDLEEETDFPNHYYQSALLGSEHLRNTHELTLKKYDGRWIGIIESYFHSIDKITRNLKSVLRYDEETVIVEKARKTDSDTIRHLAANTHFIREIKPNNEVIPEKLLVKQPEIEYGIYENRFIKTLIKKLVFFVDRRIKELREAVLATQESAIDYSSKFNYSASTYDINISIKETNLTEGGNVEKHNKALLVRAERLNELLNKMSRSNFMKQMTMYKDVRSPIMKTQIILKNTDYKNCYMLWVYLEQQQSVTTYDEIKTESLIPLSPLFKKSLSQASMYILSSFQSASLSKEEILEKLKKEKFNYERPKVKSLNELDVDYQDDQLLTSLETNEFFLNKMEQVLLQKTNQLVSNEKGTKTGLKQALTDLTLLTNAVYQKYFDLPTETNIFNRMVKEDDLEKRFTDLSEKVNTLSIINQVKYSDYRSNVLLLNEYYRESLKLEKEVFKKTRKGARTSVTEAMKESFRKEKRKIDKIVKKARADQNLIIKEERKELANYRKEVRELVKLRKKEINKLMKQQQSRLARSNKTKLTNYQKEEIKKHNIITNEKLKQINKDINILTTSLNKISK